MFAYCNRYTEDLFRKGIEKGDILWFLDRAVHSFTNNCFYFTLYFTGIMYCGLEVACQLYNVLTEKTTLIQILTFGPMFITSFHSMACGIPLITQRHSNKKIYNEYFELWTLKSNDKESMKEIRKVFQQAVYAVIFYIVITSLTGMGFLPFDGINYDKTIWPAIAALNLIKDGPKVVIYSITVLNYAFVFVKGTFICTYGLHLMHFCILYQTQNILLIGRLNAIKSEYLKQPNLQLIDDSNYQSYVERVLKSCIKLDVKLKRFADSIIRHFKIVVFIHVNDVVLELTFLYYITIFVQENISPLGFTTFILGCSMMSCTYAYYSEVFYDQMNQIHAALSETPWYTFNVSNRKLMIIFFSNLTKPQYITALGVFDVNWVGLIWIMHKCINYLTVLYNLSKAHIE